MTDSTKEKSAARDIPHPSGVPCVTLTGKWGGFVWQNTDPRFANAADAVRPRLQRRTNPPQKDPLTVKQWLWRDLWRNAELEWKGLPENQKRFAQIVARSEGYVDGHQFFIGAVMGFMSEFLPFFDKGGRRRTRGRGG